MTPFPSPLPTTILVNTPVIRVPLVLRNLTASNSSNSNSSTAGPPPLNDPVKLQAWKEGLALLMANILQLPASNVRISLVEAIFSSRRLGGLESSASTTSLREPAAVAAAAPAHAGGRSLAGTIVGYRILFDVDQSAAANSTVLTAVRNSGIGNGSVAGALEAVVQGDQAAATAAGIAPRAFVDSLILALDSGTPIDGEFGTITTPTVPVPVVIFERPSHSPRPVAAPVSADDSSVVLGAAIGGAVGGLLLVGGVLVYLKMTGVIGRGGAAAAAARGGAGLFGGPFKGFDGLFASKATSTAGGDAVAMFAAVNPMAAAASASGPRRAGMAHVLNAHGAGIQGRPGAPRLPGKTDAAPASAVPPTAGPSGAASSSGSGAPQGSLLSLAALPAPAAASFPAGSSRARTNGGVRKLFVSDPQPISIMGGVGGAGADGGPTPAADNGRRW
jgi:hypothetical protein